MKKIIASNYKGKWFILEDGEHGDAPHIDVAWAVGEGLEEHVDNCRYYGIPAYLGDDKELNERIEAINKKFDAFENPAPLPTTR